MSIRVKLKGRNTVIRNIGSAKRAGKMGSRLGLRSISEVIKKKATDNVMTRSKYPYNKSQRPSDLAIAKCWDSTDPSYKGGEVELVLVNYSPHAKYVEFGTTGPIYAKGGKPLHFRDPGTGKWVSVWSVKGQQPMHFLYDAIDSNKTQYKRIIRDDIKHWFRLNIRR